MEKRSVKHSSTITVISWILLMEQTSHGKSVLTCWLQHRLKTHLLLKQNARAYSISVPRNFALQRVYARFLQRAEPITLYIKAVNKSVTQPIIKALCGHSCSVSIWKPVWKFTNAVDSRLSTVVLSDLKKRCFTTESEPFRNYSTETLHSMDVAHFRSLWM